MLDVMQRLVGSAEVQAMLGVSRNRAYEITRHKDFPAALADLTMGKVWGLDDVQSWAERKGRTLAPLAAPDGDAGDA